MHISRTLSPINDLHDAGRDERKSIAVDIGIVFVGGLTLFVLLILLLIGPGWPRTAEGDLSPTSGFFDAFSLLALDPAGMTQFVALAGVVLALNRFDRHSPDELGTDAAVRLWTRLDFRSLVQFILTFVAATAPYRALTWLVLHADEPGWSREAAASAGTCVILWLLLLLAGPTGTVFGLHSIQRQWHLADVIHRAGRLEQAWGHRWGRPLHSSDTSRFLQLRIAGNWSTIIALVAAAIPLLTLVVTPDYEFWTDPLYANFAIGLGLYLLVVGLAGLALTAGLSLLSLRVGNQGRAKGSAVCKSLSLAVPFLFGLGTATALGTPYIPALGAVLLVSWVQYACAMGLLREGPLRAQTWSPVRRLILNLRQLSHFQAHTRWMLLQTHWSAGLDRLPRRDAKKAIKEARHWRAKHALALPFLD